MRTKKSALTFFSLVVILGVLLSGCGQAAPAPQISTQQVDSAKVISDAIVSYYEKMPQDSYKIDDPILKAELAKNPDKYVVLDVRQADAYAKGHIKGAINVAYGPEIATNLDKIRAVAKGKTLVVQCYTGQTAGQTDSMLNLAGINTRSLNYGFDGLQGWNTLKFPVVTDSTPMPDAPVVESPNKIIDDAVKKYFKDMPQDSYKIDDPILKEELAQNADKYFIVDVRKKIDFDNGHIKGAINVPFGSEIGKQLGMLKEKSQGKTLVAYCYTGQTAGQTVPLLNIAGINAKSLNFGFGIVGLPKSWSGLGYEQEK
ncbi:MAG: rhodanese-like domain-containing protein [Desulfitobacteriaceae bacterium]